MLRGIYTAAAGIGMTRERMAVIANNISNINTIGYKKDVFTTKSFTTTTPNPSLKRRGTEAQTSPLLRENGNAVNRPSWGGSNYV